MSDRRRGILFAAASALAALIAASAVAEHERSLDSAAGDLRPVLVARATLEPGVPIKPRDVEVRRFPSSFLPVSVLSAPSQVTGRTPATAVPAGAYLVPAVFSRAAERPVDREPVTPRGTPVEVGVTGGGALRGAEGARVDVLVTRDSPRGLGGTTKLAIAGARLLALESEGGEPGESMATLAVGRDDAPRLLEADSYAREIRLIVSSR